MIWTSGREVYCWPGETVERLQVIAASMAGAGQLVACSVDLVHLVALAFHGHRGIGELVLGPGSAGGHGTWTSRDLDGLVRSCCWPWGTVERLQVIAASMAGAGQLVAGSVDPVHLVALGVVQPPDRAGTRASCDLDAREGGLLLARGNGRAAAGDRRLDGGGWPAGRRQCGSGAPGCPGVRWPWGTCELAQGPGSAGGHGTRTSRDLDGLVRSCCWPGGTVERLQVIAASMAGAGQLVAGSETHFPTK
ncbi:hypothetical protein [Aeromonas dhakensis]|uniref:hypothetical protein n=1 Tax=Aeromonas dhakensis TaxID=196024 RepID=UPI002B48F50A|nr:hypothetical protein [Aeromonas dhakensis]